MPTLPDSGLTIKIIENSDISSDLDEAIRDGLVESYPADSEYYSRRRAWHSIPEWVVCALTEDGTVAGFMAVVERQVTVGWDSIPVAVAGLQGVFVSPPWRKTGLFDSIMECALEEARKRGLDAGLLFCLPVLENKVYGRFGWKIIDVEVLMEDHSGVKVPLPPKNIAMVIPLNIEKFPEGDIDLNGPDW